MSPERARPVSSQEQISSVDGTIVGEYLKEALSYPLLTEEQEQRFGFHCLAGRQAKLLKQNAADCYLLTEELSMRFDRIIAQGNESEIALVQHNLRFPFEDARTYALKYDLPMEDFLAAGKLGLFEAAKRYDPGEGKFLSYAGYWIENEMQKTLDQFGSLVVAKTTQQDVRKYRFIFSRYQDSHQGTKPTEEYMMEHMNATSVHVNNVRQASEQVVYSLEASDEGDHGGSENHVLNRHQVQSFFEVTSPDTVENQVQQRILRETLEQQMEKRIPLQQCLTIQKVIGWNNNEPMNGAELGRRMGQSKQAISERLIAGFTTLKNDPVVQAWQE